MPFWKRRWSIRDNALERELIWRNDLNLFTLAADEEQIGDMLHRILRAHFHGFSVAERDGAVNASRPKP
jgi:hypothetical protein